MRTPGSFRLSLPMINHKSSFELISSYIQMRNHQFLHVFTVQNINDVYDSQHNFIERQLLHCENISKRLVLIVACECCHSESCGIIVIYNTVIIIIRIFILHNNIKYINYC